MFLAFFAFLLTLNFSLPSNLDASLVHTHAVQISDEGVGGMSCTAFVVDSFRGLLVTAEHCLPQPDTSQPIQILTVKGEGTAQLVKLEGHAALLKTNILGLPPLSLAKRDPEPGDEVYAVGFGRVLKDYMILFGHVSKAHMDLPGWGTDCTLIDRVFEDGMSGGPVFNLKNEVIGLVEASTSAVGVADPVSKIRKLVK